MKSTEFTTTILKPDEGYFLTQVEDVDIRNRVIATTVALGKNDSADNWKEINSEIAEEYRKLQKEAFEEDAKKARENSSIKE